MRHEKNPCIDHVATVKKSHVVSHDGNDLKIMYEYNTNYFTKSRSHQGYLVSSLLPFMIISYSK